MEPQTAPTITLTPEQTAALQTSPLPATVATPAPVVTAATPTAVANAAYNATDDVTPGYKTTEFWAIVAFLITALVNASGLFPGFHLDAASVYTIGGLVLAYVASRFGLKTGSDSTQVAITQALASLHAPAPTLVVTAPSSAT